MVLQPGATSSLDLEKRDRKMAKVIIDIVGLEPEKYRLGYTKVTDEWTDATALSPQSRTASLPLLERGREGLYLLPYFGGCCFSLFFGVHFLALLSTLGHFHFSSPLLFFL